MPIDCFAKSSAINDLCNRTMDARFVVRQNEQAKATRQRFGIASNSSICRTSAARLLDRGQAAIDGQRLGDTKTMRRINTQAFNASPLAPRVAHGPRRP
jgi:hypothetical protein